jgi:E3 ubiquitin-protein ligase DOA10
MECRFCGDDISTRDLVCPCKCDGSSKWVHRTCLEKSRNTPQSTKQCMACRHVYEFEESIVLNYFRPVWKNDQSHKLLFTIHTVLAYIIADYLGQSQLFENLHPILKYPPWALVLETNNYLIYLLYFNFSRTLILAVYWYILNIVTTPPRRMVIEILQTNHIKHEVVVLLVLGPGSLVLYIAHSVLEELVLSNINEVLDRKPIKNYHLFD